MTVSGSPSARGVVGVWAQDADQAAQAACLAAELGLPVLGSPPDVREERAGPGELAPGELLLVLTATRLELRSLRRRGPGPVHAEFVEGAAGRRLRAATVGGELLARAVGLAAGCRTVLDATAGLGGDSCLLARLGAQVTASERNPVVAALLADGLRRARAEPELAARLDRLSVQAGDARLLLARLAGGPVEARPDVVLIDPMFPDGRSAASRKAMQQFRALLGDDADADELLPLALACARRRVIVKRPRHAPVLAGLLPQVSYPGRSTRFDGYLVAPAPASPEPAPKAR